MSRAGRSLLAVPALLLVGCAGDAPPTATPVVVATVPPTPAPTATPLPRAFGARARILGYSRAGQRYQTPPPVYRRGDVIDFDCGPTDENGRFIEPWPNSGEWYPSSNALVYGRDYTMARFDSLQPELFIRSIAPAGTISMICKVAGFMSNTLTLPVIDR